ncbi:MAG TPA: hypothetical protein VFL79_22000 [Terriglobia bacterium]|nr:hypothetical protein [Terriglobia bacterium]
MAPIMPRKPGTVVNHSAKIGSREATFGPPEPEWQTEATMRKKKLKKPKWRSIASIRNPSLQFLEIF